VSTGHGRRARRTIKAVLAPAWIEFEGAAQVAQLSRTVTKNGKKTVEASGSAWTASPTAPSWRRGACSSRYRPSSWSAPRSSPTSSRTTGSATT
jgi:hypothetical protein